jgi:hypothetical protein
MVPSKRLALSSNPGILKKLPHSQRITEPEGFPLSTSVPQPPRNLLHSKFLLKVVS